MANDALKALLENELLTDEVKATVEAAFNKIVEDQKTLAEATAIEEAGKALNEALAEAKTEMEAKVRTEIATKFVNEKAELVKSLDEKLSEMLFSEIDQLKEDINNFRDLEVEFVAKLEDEKDRLSEEFQSQKKIFITTIDEFVDSKLDAELEELSEDIKSIKQNTAGMKMFEMVSDMYEDSFADKDEHVASVKEKLESMEAEKEEIKEIAEALGEKVISMQREKALSETLAPLTGKRRAVMSSILEGYAPEQFGAVYKKMVTRVMDTVAAKEVADEVVTESVDEVVTEDNLPPTVEINDGNGKIEESEDLTDEVVQDEFSDMRKLAGLLTK